MDKLKQWVALTVVGCLGIMAAGWFLLAGAIGCAIVADGQVDIVSISWGTCENLANPFSIGATEVLVVHASTDDLLKQAADGAD